MPKKVVKKESKKLTLHDVLGRWMVSTNNDLTDTMIELDDVRTSVIHMRVAIWALVAYAVVFTGLFLLVLYGNQYLVK